MTPDLVAELMRQLLREAIVLAAPLLIAAAALTEADEPVLTAAGQAIAIPPGEVSVGADGTISVAGGAVATVGVVTFPAGTELTPEGANRYVAPAGVTPVAAKDAAVHEGALEAANQDVVQGSLNLIVMQR